MHIQGTPQTMQFNPQYGDVVEEVFAWLAARRDALVGGRDCPGPHRPWIRGSASGKTAAHNLALLTMSRFRDLGCPLLIGVSRKAFIGHVIGDPGGRPHRRHDRRRCAARQGVEPGA